MTSSLAPENDGTPENTKKPLSNPSPGRFALFSALLLMAVSACAFLAPQQLLSSPQSPPVDADPVGARRKLQHRPVNSWTTSESFETDKGSLPTISCPLGMYRELGTSNLARPVGQRHDGCKECPRGRYGSTTDLTNDFCTADCPKGKYRDTPGATSAEDCFFCPEGSIGSLEGLTTKECSAKCTDSNTGLKSYYSDVVGLTRARDCKECPPGYRGWQCKWDLIPRLGHFSSPNGRLDERAHQYLKQGSDGSWSGEKKEGDWAGAWPTSGATPENALKYPGKIAWDTKNEGFSYDPASTPRATIDKVP
mmetsp:Transcript_1845/g.4060  ORF Transcript_1845/g.4060 Transcript_1845/m.4060 type:complete len:308 (+) Transcript_1845:77-1000(+)|eukprot:CAMPEP_0197554068 /NCGR_PEP_ID=MMETSP1320-20131121/10538_1 /TAXON_ID=91990 /ORGANISM="Bolidomonas sp., Strain RCC2347" /LENGTH=307 /DNA_ID=CAMNT_0043114921 /DNA_START=77 /DNA_END=1000 /DNA_ORIENTATION=-